MNNTQWGHVADDSSRPESTREIIKKGQSESRILVRQIYREQIEQGVRSQIARLMRRSRDPWHAAEEDAKPTRNAASPMNL